MHGYYGYGYAPRYGSDPYATVGQEFDPAPPRLQAYEQHAERQVAALAASMPTTSFFTWILDADGREYVHPFASADAMSAMLRRKNHNFYYAANFDKTSPVWPKPNASGYGCHAPEWIPEPQGACPSTVSGWPWGYVGQALPAPPPVSPNLRAWTAALNSYLLERGRRPTPRDKGDYLMQAAFEHFLAAGMSDQEIVSTFLRVAEYWAQMLKTYGSFQRMPSTIPPELLR